MDALQGSLFHEDIYEALGTVAKALGGYKEAGHKLRPDLRPDKAGEWLANCLNRTRNEKLDPEQTLFLLREGRRIGCHVAMHYIADDTGYQTPQPIEPRDETAELRRQYIAAAKGMAALVERIERLERGG